MYRETTFESNFDKFNLLNFRGFIGTSLEICRLFAKQFSQNFGINNFLNHCYIVILF